MIVAFCCAVTVACTTGGMTGTPRTGYERGRIPRPEPDIVSRLDTLAETDMRPVIEVRSPSDPCAPAARDFDQPLDEAGHRYFAGYYVHMDAALFVRSRTLIGPGLVGYLLIVPGMYGSDVVDLWVFDIVHDRWFPPIELADAWGTRANGTTCRRGSSTWMETATVTS